MIILADDRSMPGDAGLSPEAQELDARCRDIVTSLTDAPAAPPAPTRPRPWHRGGHGRAWAWLAWGLFLVFTTLALFEVLDDDAPEADDRTADATAPADPPASSAPPGGRWHFTADDGGSGLYTIDLLGDGSGGAVDVVEDGTASGTYTWVEDALSIDFTRVVTLSDGSEVTEPSSFSCTGTPEMDSLTCTYERELWAYRPEAGLVVEGTSTAPTHGTRE
jgi:hypothetical protein